MTKEELVAFIFSELDEKWDNIERKNELILMSIRQNNIYASNENLKIVLIHTLKFNHLTLKIKYKRKTDKLSIKMSEEVGFKIENEIIVICKETLFKMIDNIKKFKEII